MADSTILHDDAAHRNGQPHVDEFDPAKLGQTALGAATDPAPDPFDVEKLRIGHDLAMGLGVNKKLNTVPVRKPTKPQYCRTHPSPLYRLQTGILEIKGDRGGELFLVSPNLWPDLATESMFKPKLLTLAIDRQQVLFLWEANLPKQGGREDEWSRSMLEAVETASTQWVRVVANMSLGAYEMYVATGNLGEPKWPDMPFKEILRIAFRDRFIQDHSHPVLRQLRGEI